MTQVMVFQKPVYKRHYASLLSISNCLNFIIWISVFILPFIAAFTSYNFWIKEGTFREQPRAKFKKNLFMILEVNDSAASAPSSDYSKVITWSSSNSVNEVMSSTSRQPVVETYDQDSNQDGVSDAINISLSVPVFATEKVHRVAVVALLEYALKDRTQFQMESLAFLDHSSPLPGRALVADGDISLYQRTPLFVRGGMQVWYESAKESLMTSSDSSGIQEWQLDSIMQDYNARNFTTRYDTSSELWLSAAPPALGESERNFFVNMTMRIPPEKLEYYTEWSECIKFAFVQYVPLFLLFKYLLNWLRKYIYENQVCETQFVIDSQYGRVKPHSF